MAPVIGRLKKRPDFLRVAGARRSWVTPGLILQARRRAGGETQQEDADSVIRVGFTASRKVGGAVHRNRARRRLRAACRDVLPALGRPGTDYVLVARKGTVTRPYTALLGDLREALEHLAKNARQAKPRRAAAGPCA